MDELTELFFVNQLREHVVTSQLAHLEGQVSIHLKNVSCEYDGVNGSCSTLQAAWYMFR